MSIRTHTALREQKQAAEKIFRSLIDISSISQRTKYFFSNLFLFRSATWVLVYNLLFLEWLFLHLLLDQGCCLHERTQGLLQVCGAVSCAAKSELATMFSAIKST